MKQLLVAAALAAAACSGGQKTDTGTGTGTGAGSGSAAAGSGSAAAATGPITRAECEDMAGHILQVGLAETKKTKPPEEWPTTEQIDAIRLKWIKDDKWMEQCLAFDRASFTCVMAAADTGTLQACSGAEE